MQEVEVKLSVWVFNAIRHQEVLTLHRDYFRLRKPLERRMYELARKHCGKKVEWKISLQLLLKKCGSASTEKEFRRLVSNIAQLVSNIAQEDERFHHMPDYSVTLDSSDMIVFRSRGSVPYNSAALTVQVGGLSAETYHDARIVAP
jgi:hypothetical protein